MNRFINVSYVPFVGWLFPMAVKENSSFALDHAKQGFILALFFTGVLITLFLINLSIPSMYHIFRLGLAVVIYGVYGFYFFLCGLGTYYAHKGKFHAFPVVKDFTEKLGF
ncbi:MAG TPA: hypothetical protein PK926_00840 [Spirochaetota bacterium]|nr:hypothetical protein [Spirochaetota bacterium]HPI87896.1 hypothetical protein [Spirochaetota bacterium]HPR47372.1 hypothetical protein [Spirochaetota bacterium]